MAKSVGSCPICKKPAKRSIKFADSEGFSCKDCGKFRISRTLLETLHQYGISARRAALLSAVMRANYGSVPLVTTYDIQG